VRLNLNKLTPAEKDEAKRAVGLILVEGINDKLDSSTSPVKGGKFKSLKQDNTASLLFESGAMRSQIRFESIDNEDIVEVGVFESAPEVEKLKAFNHNTGDTLPKRRFIASPNQRFKDDIMDKAIDAVDTIKERSKAEAIILDELVKELLES